MSDSFPGKYDSARDAVLHFLCTSEWANESFGDVNDYGVYLWRISNGVDDVSPRNMEFNSLAQDEITSVLQGLELQESALRASLVGHFLVSENSQGQVIVKRYTLESELVRHFNAFHTHFLDWEASQQQDND